MRSHVTQSFLLTSAIVAGCTALPNRAPMPATPQKASSSRDFVYVVNQGFGLGAPVSVFAAGATKLVRILFKNVASDSPCSIAVAPGGETYIGGDGNLIYEFAPGGTNEVRAISTGSRPHCAIALDGTGNLYVADTPTSSFSSSAADGAVSVYAPTGSTASRTIEKGVDVPEALLLDAKGDLYVANAGNDSVTIYQPGSLTPHQTITAGIAGPRGLAFDSAGNLYVANAGTWTGGGFTGSSVTEYSQGGGAPSWTISTGISAPSALVVDTAKNVYVANAPPGKRGWVSVYANQATKPSRTIVTGIDVPLALALDSSNELYVANARGLKLGSVTVYAAHSGTSPLRTLATYVTDPVALAVSAR